MTNEEKIVYLNQIIFSKVGMDYNGPIILYKYRPFDEYTFDMLENEYIYLCPAEKEDDETECLTTVDYDGLIDLETNNLKKECINQIIDLIRPYTNEDTFENIKSRVFSIVSKTGTIPANFMVDLSLELQELVPQDVNIAPLVNWIVNIPEMLDRPEISSQLKPLFMTAYNARKETGICSLAESNDVDYMWDNYAANSTGYCIEYDLSNYELAKNVLPVIYQDGRETNIVIQLVGSFIGQMITDLSNGQFLSDSSHFIRLFLTKNKKWEYQKEWRFLGYANEKPKAPKIKAIYLGKNVSSENAQQIIKFANLKNIVIKKIN